MIHNDITLKKKKKEEEEKKPKTRDKNVIPTFSDFLEHAMMKATVRVRERPPKKTAQRRVTNSETEGG